MKSQLKSPKTRRTFSVKRTMIYLLFRRHAFKRQCICWCRLGWFVDVMRQLDSTVSAFIFFIEQTSLRFMPFLWLLFHERTNINGLTLPHPKTCVTAKFLLSVPFCLLCRVLTLANTTLLLAKGTAPYLRPSELVTKSRSKFLGGQRASGYFVFWLRFDSLTVSRCQVRVGTQWQNTQNFAFAENPESHPDVKCQNFHVSMGVSWWSQTTVARNYTEAKTVNRFDWGYRRRETNRQLRRKQSQTEKTWFFFPKSHAKSRNDQK